MSIAHAAVRGGSIEELVMLLFDPPSSAVDKKTYLQSFLLTVNSFVTPTQLLSLISIFYTHANRFVFKTCRDASVFRLAIIVFLKKWFALHGSFFKPDERALAELLCKATVATIGEAGETASKSLIQVLEPPRGSRTLSAADLSSSPSSPVPLTNSGSFYSSSCTNLSLSAPEDAAITAQADQVIAELEAFLALSPSSEALQRLAARAAELLPLSTAAAGTRFSLSQMDPIRLARQLSMEDQHLFGLIKSNEFLDCGWTKPT